MCVLDEELPKLPKCVCSGQQKREERDEENKIKTRALERHSSRDSVDICRRRMELIL